MPVMMLGLDGTGSQAFDEPRLLFVDNHCNECGVDGYRSNPAIMELRDNAHHESATSMSDSRPAPYSWPARCTRTHHRHVDAISRLMIIPLYQQAQPHTACGPVN
ncbi:hypothetical protein NPIL_391641 [Nephila pilipes]|uniref:Uncharacterized protein n=1 Tax=Nephila pilipes TaxID=299642 RepID=A0A8X6TDJ8_NEPPI|nr:hypothetical protein NPIL_391641 [Nephila pilipes]